MKDFYTALQHCLNAIDLGIDLESCLSLYPEYEEQLRQFFKKWNGSRDAINGLSEKAIERLLFDQALDECIKAVGRGESPESCYERYPAYARKMRPWLLAVSELPKLRRDGRLQTELTFDDFFIPEVPFTQALEEYIQAYRNKESNIVLQRYPYYADRLQFWADKIPEQPQIPKTPPPPALAKRLSPSIGGLFFNSSLQVPAAILLTLLLFFFSGVRLARAAAATIPGEPLYPLKLMVEQIHLNIAPEDQKADLKAQFAEERRKEASALIEADIRQEVAFDGQITSVDQDRVIVSNVVVLLDGLGGRLPAFIKGETVHVEGVTGQKGVVVKRIDVHSSSGLDKTFVVSPVPPLSTFNAPNPSATPLAIVQRSPTPSKGSNATSNSNSTSGGSTSSSSGSGTNPTPLPTVAPTSKPTIAPTNIPTELPTVAPTEIPTSEPTAIPTSVPTSEPTVVPTNVPAPTSEPTIAPTNPPIEPTAAPTNNPPTEPTAAPTDSPPIDATSAPVGNPTPAPAPTSGPQ